MPLAPMDVLPGAAVPPLPQLLTPFLITFSHHPDRATCGLSETARDARLPGRAQRRPMRPLSSGTARRGRGFAALSAGPPASACCPICAVTPVCRPTAAPAASRTAPPASPPPSTLSAFADDVGHLTHGP